MQQQQRSDESPYTMPIVLLVVGIILGGLAVGLASADEANQPPAVILAVLYGLGGLLSFIGAVSTSVVLGTSDLRR